MDPTLWSHDQGARLVAVRKPEDGQLHRETELLFGPNKGDLAILKELIEAGKLTPVIDRMYSLSETRDAIRDLEEGHARGKVVITASGEGA